MRRVGFVVAVFLAAQVASASTASYSGTFSTPEEVFTTTVTLASAGTIGLQTWGFGGGTNAASQYFPGGGFDPFVGVFSGTGDSAVFIDGTSDILSNYIGGCPPAGTQNIGKVPVCGDVTLSESLAAGTYTILLTDGEYIPNAAYETVGLLGDGFNDLAQGVFQTCTTETDCITPSGVWALDITTPDSGTPAVPEPNGLWAPGFLLLAWGAAGRLRLSALKNS